jgi:hypothetical protein
MIRERIKQAALTIRGEPLGTIGEMYSNGTRWALKIGDKVKRRGFYQEKTSQSA